jgi:hypothetical protein
MFVLYIDDQCIDETEFIAHWTNLKLGDLDAAIRLFHHADTDRDGCIEKDPDYSRLFYYFDRDGMIFVLSLKRCKGDLLYNILLIYKR